MKGFQNIISNSFVAVESSEFRFEDGVLNLVLRGLDTVHSA